MESGGQSLLWPLAVHIGLAILIALGMLGLSYFLGERRRGGGPNEPYECGFRPAKGMPQTSVVKYFRMAVFFLVFDLEIVFIITWALVAKRVGWIGYGAIVVFVALLMVALVYLWKRGALDWGSRNSAPRKMEP